MRPLADDIRVICIPQALVEAMWSRCVPHLVRGLMAATNVTLAQIAADVLAGSDDLWAIFEGREMVAAFLTSQWRDDAGEGVLGVYGLGGAGMRRWAALMDRTMQAEAKRRGLTRIRCAGRGAWSRVLPDLPRVGTWNDHNIYERAVR